MHAHALTSPLTVAQNNQDILVSLKGQPSPDPLKICVNCHAPVGAAMSQQVELPLPEPRMNEGIDCVACHQYDGDATASSGGLASKFQASLYPGKAYFGPINDPVGNPYHRSRSTALYAQSNALCATCHDVGYDLDGDGKIVKGKDLVLQQTYEEYLRYQRAGGTETCVSCHMAPLPGVTRAAEAAQISGQQDYSAPPRVVHDHSFVGVDYPLDTVSATDPQKAARAALLKSAARLDVTVDEAVVGKGLSFRVSITNLSGHGLPTGFAFARQMWLEVAVDSRIGRLLSSGLLVDPTDDLCDASTMSESKDSPIRAALKVTCAAPDPLLVNLQTKLVDHIQPLLDKDGSVVVDSAGDAKLAQADKSEETILQHLSGGAVVRVRPIDKQPLSPLDPGETRSFVYHTPLPPNVSPLTVYVRLLFRNLPPYFLRALANRQSREAIARGEPDMAPLVKNLQTVAIAGSKVTVTAQ
jgi:hypothetical protein